MGASFDETSWQQQSYAAQERMLAGREGSMLVELSEIGVLSLALLQVMRIKWRGSLSHLNGVCLCGFCCRER